MVGLIHFGGMGDNPDWDRGWHPKEVKMSKVIHSLTKNVAPNVRRVPFVA